MTYIFNRGNTVQNYILYLRHRLQILLLIFQEFTETNFCFPWIHQETKFSDDFRGKRMHYFCLNSLNIRSKIWRPLLMTMNKKCNFSSVCCSIFFTNQNQTFTGVLWKTPAHIKNFAKFLRIASLQNQLWVIIFG